MPGAFNKIIIYIIIIKHLYSVINKLQGAFLAPGTGRVAVVAQVAHGGQGESWETGTVAVLISQGGAGAAEPADATHKEPKHVVQKDGRINSGIR